MGGEMIRKIFYAAIIWMLPNIALAVPPPYGPIEYQNLHGLADAITYGADATGASDSYPAILSAISAVGPGGTVQIPNGTYYLSANPYATISSSINFAISPGTTFTGPGSSGLTGFAHLFTNGFNSISGPWDLYDGLPSPLSGANTTAGIASELLGPPSGAASQVLEYFGSDSNGNVTSGNVQENLNLVQNVHKADLIGTSIYKPFEIDLDVDVSTSMAPLANSGNGLIGMLMTGGGAGGSFQGSGMLGLIFQRTTGSWGNALTIQNSNNGLVVNASTIPINIQTTYFGNSTDPNCPSGTFPSGCTIDSGIVFSNAGTYANTEIAGSQLANGDDTIRFDRATDTSPTGTLLRFRNAANTADIFSVSSGGQETLQATGENTQIFLNAPSSFEGLLQLGYNGTFTGAVGTSSSQSIFLFDNTNGETPFNVTSGGVTTIGEVNKGVTSNTFFRPQITTVSNLATADPSPQAGDTLSVSDTTGCTANSTVTGGGGTSCALVYSGTSWKAIVTH